MPSESSSFKRFFGSSEGWGLREIVMLAVLILLPLCVIAGTMQMISFVRDGSGGAASPIPQASPRP